MALGTLKTFGTQTAAQIRADAGIYLFIAVYAAGGFLLMQAAGAGDRAAYALYAQQGVLMFGLLMPGVALVFDFCWIIHRFDRRRGLAFRRVFSAARLARMAAGLCLLQAMALFFGTFTSLKNLLPLLHGGFPYDRLHADIDAALHGGVDPWLLLQPVLGSDVMRGIIEWNYNVLWFALCYGVLFFVATSPKARHVRARYIFGFMLVWIVVGNVLAGLFLSAGPAFYGLVTGDVARFAAQLEFLARSGATGHSAAAYQHYLWAGYEASRTGIGSGISAFPSVHVAVVCLNAFFLHAHSRKLAPLGYAYVVFLIASSVYLAWHYAIDGYAAFAVTGVIYLGMKKLAPGAGRRETAPVPLPSKLDFPEALG